jgi:hypothetical protein
MSHRTLDEWAIGRSAAGPEDPPLPALRRAGSRDSPNRRLPREAGSAGAMVDDGLEKNPADHARGLSHGPRTCTRVRVSPTPLCSPTQHPSPRLSTSRHRFHTPSSRASCGFACDAPAPIALCSCILSGPLRIDPPRMLWSRAVSGLSEAIDARWAMFGQFGLVRAGRGGQAPWVRLQRWVAPKKPIGPVAPHG